MHCLPGLHISAPNVLPVEPEKRKDADDLRAATDLHVVPLEDIRGAELVPRLVLLQHIDAERLLAGVVEPVGELGRARPEGGA